MSDRTPNLADIIRQAIEDRLSELHVMLPGRIDRYDASTQKADVEPLIRRLQRTVDGEINEEFPVIPNVPVAFPRAGGFKITMPVNVGDRCMLIFCERSTEAYQIGQERRGTSSAIGQTDPQTFDLHNLTDAVAYLGWYNDAEALSATDSTDMVLGEEGGPVIHVGNDQVNLYEKSASEFVALADKTKAQLDTLANDINALKAAFTAWTPVPQDGGAALKVAAETWSGSNVSVITPAATKVKAT